MPLIISILLLLLFYLQTIGLNVIFALILFYIGFVIVCLYTNIPSDQLQLQLHIKFLYE